MIDLEVLVAALVAAAAVFVCAVLSSRAQFNRKQRSGEISQRTRRTGAAIGNALQVIQEFVHPHTRYVLQERLKEHEDQDESGELIDPAEHLLRQARRIQRGEQLERITTRWPHLDRSDTPRK